MYIFLVISRLTFLHCFEISKKKQNLDVKFDQK